jgi:tetratricopeptide (TPR) repeat protein
VIKVLVGALVVVVMIFGVIYYIGQHTASTPSLAEQSVTVAEKAVTENPNNVAARLTLAAAYGQSERFDEALTQYQEILKFAKDNRTAMFGAAKILYQQANYSAAQRQFEAMVEASGTGEFAGADPQLEEALYYLGNVKLQQGDVPGAITNYQNALKIDRSDADAWNGLGGALLRSGDANGAVDAYQRAITFVPTGWCDPYQGLANAYQTLKNADGSEYAQAMTDICVGKPADAIPRLEAIAGRDFRLQALLGIGIAYDADEDFPNAIEAYRKVVAVDPTNITALNALARLGAADSAAPRPSATPTKSASAS